MPQTVLVVDDEKNIRRTLRMVLEGESYEVEEAESAEAAIALVETLRPEPIDQEWERHLPRGSHMIDQRRPEGRNFEGDVDHRSG